jgi:tetratricopeptide (TPR) repeat protein
MKMDLAAMHKTIRQDSLLLIAAWAVLFLTAIIVYLPGLHGPFVLDDFGAIAALGNSGGISSWETFSAYVFGGYAGPTGRPVALLTFLLDANNWPTDAFPFKRTNLIIHLINGALLGILIRQILGLLQFEIQNAKWIALISTACWLLHPFLVSTTLYAVQRMAQLATLFILAGLVSYLYGRSLLAINGVKAYWVMSIAIGLFTLLALLSKENGILLPVLVGVLEMTVVASQRDRLGRLNRYWSSVFIVAPAFVIAAYLVRTLFNDDFFEVVPPRDFSLYERMLTQPRILVDYLQHWFIPKLYTSGVFQDHFIKSTGVFSPISTVLAIGLHGFAIGLAIVKRRQWPLIALAILFFYASHLLESTVLNLELYFEHRNYLAVVFVFLPAVAFLYEKASRRTVAATSLVALLLLASFTRYSATVWADFPSMVEASARKAPTSARAQSRYAANLFNAQRFDESMQVLDSAIANIPGVHPLLLVNRLIILCNLGVLDEQENDRVAGVLSKTNYDPRIIKIYVSFIDGVIDKRCPDVELSSVRSMFEAMLKNPNNGAPETLEYSQLKYFVGFSFAFEGDRSAAFAAFNASLRARPGASHAMQMAAVMASNEFYEEALQLSDSALSQLAIPENYLVNDRSVAEADVRNFQTVIRADMAELPSDDTADPDR